MDKEIAEKVVHQTLSVSENQVVEIRGDKNVIDFMEILAVEVEAAGGFPFINVFSDEYIENKCKYVPDKYLRRTPYVLKELTERKNKIINIISRDPQKTFKVPSGKLKLFRAAYRALEEEEDKKQIPNVQVVYPTKERSAFYGMEFGKYKKILLDALNIDYLKLRARGEKILKLLNNGDKLQIKTANGTDVAMSIQEREAKLLDGIIDEENINSGNYLESLPSGCIYILPVEGSANGTIVFEKAYLRGQLLENLTFEFRKGKLIRYSAEQNGDVFQRIMNGATGDKDKISHVGVGLNPGITKPTGDLVLDEHVIGAFFLALGENRYLGGKNSSSLNIDFVTFDTEVYLDDKLIIVQ